MKFLNKIKVIFLDIDGVLNIIPEEYDQYGGIFHQHLNLSIEYRFGVMMI